MEIKAGFNHLSLDIERQILIWLSADDLWHMLQVSKVRAQLVQEIYRKRRSLEFYQAEFKDSYLCDHLIDITSGQSLRKYFNAFLPPEWLQNVTFSSLSSDPLENLDALIQKALRYMKSEYLAQLQINIDNQEILFAESKSITTQLGAYSIQDFLALPYINITELEARLSLARDYRHVEASLMLLLLFILAERSSSNQTVLFIADGRLSRWLTGSGLELINGCGEDSNLISYLVDWSLGQGTLLSQLPEVQPGLQQNALKILYRLTDKEYKKLAHRHPAVLLNAIERRCLPIIDGLGIDGLCQLLITADEATWLSLLKPIGAEQLSIVLLKLPETQRFGFPKVLLSTEVFAHYTTFMGQLLTALTFGQLNRMMEALTSNEISHLLASRAFLHFLELLADSSSGKRFTDLKDFLEFVLWFRFYPVLVPKNIQEKVHNAFVKQYEIWKTTTVNCESESDYWILVDTPEDLTTERIEHLQPACIPEVHIALLEVINQNLNLRKDCQPVRRDIGLSNQIIYTRNKKYEAEGIKKFKENDVLVRAPANPPRQNDSVVVSKKIQDCQCKPEQVQKHQSLNVALASNIFKGFFIGVLITGVAILLMMFINYQLNVPLPETINNLWIAGIAGIFADIVATACFLADAKVFEPSTFASVNEEADGSKPFNIPDQVAPTANPGYGNKPLSSVGTATAKPPVQQTHVQASLDVDRPNNLANSLY